jgi:hypothetical protein
LWLVLPRSCSSLAVVAAVVVDASLISRPITVRFEPILVYKKHAVDASAGRKKGKTTKFGA